MYQYSAQNETIVALATPPGAGGIALVRLSGPDSLAVLAGIFTGKRKGASADWPTHTVRYGWIRSADGAVLDEALVTVMRAPRSYTTEDVVEIGCHGGAVAARAVIARCVQHGARLAQPGEFTRRAYMNGRMDLAQVEAVLDVITARTDAALRAGARQLNGELSRAVASVREEVMTALAQVEALLNFPEDGTDQGQALLLRGALAKALAQLERLLATAQAGCVLREGLRVVIAGKPNVGKSSLLNAFLRQDRAIVTNIAGTTRDLLEETANVGGFPVNFVDTAGILEPRDAVELAAVSRSRHTIDHADMVILVLDQSRPLDSVDEDLLARADDGRRWLIVMNKSDLPAAIDPARLRPQTAGHAVLPLSLTTFAGFPELEQAVADLASGGHGLAESGAVVTHMRHVEALERARVLLRKSAGAWESGAPLEMAAEDMQAAVRELDRVTGRDYDADLVERIFNDFCIGK